MSTSAGGAARSARAVELRFAGPDRDLAAALVVPDGPGPFPAAVLVSGSGPVDRDSNAPQLAIDSTRQLADALAEAGIASLRYDKRGVGGSRLLRDGSTEGKHAWKRVGLFDNADDVAAAYAALAGRPEVDASRLFLVGHSEGATLVAHVGARLLAQGAGPRPAGIVLLSLAAVPGDVVLRWQTSAVLPTLPAPVRAILRLMRVDVVAKVSRNHDRIRATTTDVARIGGATINAKWFREFLDHDPRQDLRALTVPVLAVTGSKDLQVDPADLHVVAALVPGPIDTWCAPDVSHVLRTQSGPASLRAYKEDVRRPVEPAVLERVTAWMVARARPGVATEGAPQQRQATGDAPASAGTVTASDPRRARNASL
ncbi:alpha/beta hydrolase [Terrabacter sp. NPDC080008]|uniref:alpha/beta hydrolase family protein n=1 Tax=Terrabacter sp. NPDC080008 TaxID=3155176 RepID=UPI00344FB700